MIGVRTSYTWQRPPARNEPNSTGPEAVAAAGAGASINTASLMTDIKVFQTLLEAIKQDDVKKAQVGTDCNAISFIGSWLVHASFTH